MRACGRKGLFRAIPRFHGARRGTTCFAGSTTVGDIPRRVRHRERIIEHVAVGVEALGVGRELKDGIHRQEPSEVRIIDAPVHVDDADVIQHLLMREPVAVGIVIGLGFG